MSRATRAQINLSALRHNLNIARQTSNARQLAIVKANAYGHGLVQIAHALSAADGFGVATLDEAIQLRESGVYKPIVLLEGFNRASDLNLIYAYDLQPVIHCQPQIALLAEHAKHPLKLWVKVDSGMHRLGFAPDELTKVYTHLSAMACVQAPINIMTHLACADDRQSSYNMEQIQRFDRALQGLAEQPQGNISIANSAGTLGWPTSHRDWVRPGIMLYGSSPFLNSQASAHDLRPVMTLKSEVIALHDFRQGDAIGYGQAYICERDMQVATLAIGYGDGYPRHAGNGTPVLLKGQRATLVGRVSMDMISVDVSHIPDVMLGDEAILWGEGLPVEEIAECASTISYELFCGITSRVSFEYLDE